MQEQPVEMNKATVVLAEEPELVMEQNFKDINSEMQQVAQHQTAQTTLQSPVAQVQKVQPMQTENCKPDVIPVIQQTQLAVPAGYEKVLSVWTYLGMLIVSWIPLIGFIATIVWAVKTGNKNKQRFASAMLLLQIIGIIAGIFTYSATMALLKTVFEGLNTGIG